MSEERKLLELDYEKTIDLIKTLTDIRFKLLGFVPAVATLGVSLVNKSSDTGMAVGLLGLVVTVGILIYDLRNSKLYNAAVHRAKWLEYLLTMPRLTENLGQEAHQGFFTKWVGSLLNIPKFARNPRPKQHGGLFTERPRASRLFFKESKKGPLHYDLVQHDRALALIYGASIGAWTYLIVQSFLSLLSQALISLTLGNNRQTTLISQLALAIGLVPAATPPPTSQTTTLLSCLSAVISALIAISVGWLVEWQIRRYDMDNETSAHEVDSTKLGELWERFNS